MATHGEGEAPMCLTGMHGGTWGRFIKLECMEHACTALSEAHIRFKAGHACERRMEPNVPHRDAWGDMGQIKLEYMEHAYAALSEAEMVAYAHLSNHAW